MSKSVIHRGIAIAMTYAYRVSLFFLVGDFLRATPVSSLKNIESIK